MQKIGRNDPCPCGSNSKYKHCHEGKLFTFKAERFNIAAKKDGKTFKLFNIAFNQNRNGQASIIVSFPYLKESQGLLSVATFPKNLTRIEQLSLEPGGKVTSHKIKYSHWMDGNVHFSQDGKIYTLKKDPSDSLVNGVGHLFTIHIKDITGFEEKVDAKEFTSKIIDLDVEMIDKDKDTVKFTAWWYKETVIHPPRAEFSRIYNFKQEEGVISKGFALQAPDCSPLTESILLLCARQEHLTEDPGSHILFLGGFDKREIFKDLSKDFKFLAMMYPAMDYEDLKTRLGSVDLNSSDIAPQLSL
ncbi:MAG: SEC-C domain-containing protein [Patescibacteria group bacterium]